MANKSWDDDWSDYFSDPDGHPPLDELLFGNDNTIDPIAQDLMVRAVFDKDEVAYRDLVEYMADKYDIDFSAEFEWEDFRAWYETQSV